MARASPSNITRLALLVLASALLLAAISTAAQTRRPELSRFWQERSLEYQGLRAQAEARAALLGIPVRRVLSNGVVIELQRFVDGRPVYYMSENLNAADTVSTDEAWVGGSLGLLLDGSGQTLGIWDDGNIRATHQELAGRVTNFNSSALSDHATHVAGTMIGSGVNASATGMAFSGNLRGYDFNDDVAEMAAEQLSVDPVRLSNHSYGRISGWLFDFFDDGRWVWFGDVQLGSEEDSAFGFYGPLAADYDQIAFDSPDYLVVKSAGNDRNDAGPVPGSLHWHFDSAIGTFVLSFDVHPPDGGPTGYDTIDGDLGSSKNILTVGAVHDVPGGYLGPEDVVMSTFSGWGPTDDGRIKPDIVANGVGLISSVASDDTAYASFSGTSMSSPNTSGSLALLAQHADDLFGTVFKASTYRALVTHTADEAGPAPGPDYVHGWGLLNVASAAQLMTDHATATSTDHIFEVDLSDGTTESFDFESDGIGPFRATIAWTDPPGTPPVPGVDPPTLMLVNDIDLRVIDPEGVTHEPWVLDPAAPSAAAGTGDNFRDTVEQVHIEASIPGIYTVQITHKGSLAAGDSQLVSLVVSGNADGPADGPAPLIIDDGEPGTSSTGGWCVSSATDFFGTGSLYSCGSGLDTYRWTPTVGVAGDYEVAVWWSSHPNRSTNVPIRVVHAGGEETFTFDQRVDGGRWHVLGTFSFAAGTAGYVETSDVNGQAAADAVRFTPVGGGDTATLLVALAGAGGGTVTSAPAGIECGVDCSQAYPLGTVVTLTATPEAGSEFVAWGGDGDCADGVVTLNTLISCTATFDLTGTSPPLIIDDGEPGTSSTGGWCASSATDFFGTGSLYSCGSGLDTYRWTPTLGAAGDYEVAVWWSSHPNRSTNVPIRVVHAGGEETFTFDQRVDGGRWHVLGTFPFAPGATGYVEVSDVNGQAAADAVRFTPVGGGDTATLLMALAGTGGGTVTSAPAGIDCGVDCSQAYPLGTVVTLTATPEAGSEFVAWGGDGDCADGVVTLNTLISCTATFDLTGTSPPLIIDDGEPGTSSTGGWCVSSATDFFGTGSQYSCGSGLDTYRWTPTVGVAGDYEVAVWWSSHPNRSTNVPIRVVHAGGEETFNFNQKVDGGRWHVLGTFPFAAGATGYVETSDVNGQAAADAVRFTPQ